LKQIESGNDHFKTLYEGILITQNEMKKTYHRHGLIEYSPLNEKFDPNFHAALFKFSDEKKEHGTVGLVLKTGYKLNDRVIRAAQVGVVDNSTVQIEEEEQQKKS